MTILPLRREVQEVICVRSSRENPHWLCICRNQWFTWMRFTVMGVDEPSCKYVDRKASQGVSSEVLRAGGMNTVQNQQREFLKYASHRKITILIDTGGEDYLLICWTISGIQAADVYNSDVSPGFGKFRQPTGRWCNLPAEEQWVPSHEHGWLLLLLLLLLLIILKQERERLWTCRMTNNLSSPEPETIPRAQDFEH